tara:strand:- start:1617 stop:1781 length:165 start_codon:yes stop_codon:yes gene_type:complete
MVREKKIFFFDKLKEKSQFAQLGKIVLKFCKLKFEQKRRNFGGEHCDSYIEISW